MMFLEPRSGPNMLNVEAGLEESGDGVSCGNHTIEARQLFYTPQSKKFKI